LVVLTFSNQLTVSFILHNMCEVRSSEFMRVC